MSTNAVVNSMPVAPAAAARPAHLDAKVIDQLDALWRSIFARGHADEAHREPAAKASASSEPVDDAPAGRELASGRSDAVSANATFPWLDPPHVAGALEGQSPDAAPTSHAAVLEASPIEKARATARVYWEPPIASDAGIRALPDDTELARTSDELPASDQVAGAATSQTPATETVSVFMQGGAVTINVRDAALTDDEALRCAFETARTLTGERAALRTLVLNGRAVYRQAPPFQAPVSPTLVFAC